MNMFFGIALLMAAAAVSCSGTYKYIGCFKDEPGKRAMDEKVVMWHNMTNDICYDVCRSTSATNAYFGTQYKKCYCAELNVAYDKYGEVDDCSMVCPGDITQQCGGDLQMSVYKMDGCFTNRVAMCSPTTTTAQYEDLFD